MNMKNWEKCIEFHGHSCGGLAIGYKVAEYAKRLLNLTFSQDEQLVCIAENDSCSIDAIQILLGCSIGKGNLLFHMTGKQAYSFYNRLSGQSVRLVLNYRSDKQQKEQIINDYLNSEPEKLFKVTKTKIELPEKARIFKSYKCEICGEVTASNYIRIQEGKKVCIDCFDNYNRFNI